VLWIVNEVGQATYVVGRLANYQSNAYQDPFTTLGHFAIKGLSKLIPYSLPYPFPQSLTPEVALIKQAIRGRTFQQYRMNRDNKPVSLMSATPLKIKDQIVGAIILEQTMDSLLTESLSMFYRLIGIGSIVFLLVILGAVIYTASLSNRILRLDRDVRQTFDPYGRAHQLDFQDQSERGYRDELSDLRHHIYEMLSQLSGYERYLKQLPRALRHEIHNPLNRLAMSLSMLEKDVQHKQLSYAQRALEQLKQIIASMSEASSIEDSLHAQPREAFPVGEMLTHYFDSVTSMDAERFDVQQTLTGQLQVLGDGFMLEQLLDKLISNAKDFDNGQCPISLSAHKRGQWIEIRVKNCGPHLPEGYETQLFDGMLSIRRFNQDEQAHLGLGLYIARLIANFHQGTLEAENWSDTSEKTGVVFILRLPLADE
jgi:signal transduction histidine kinase